MSDHGFSTDPSMVRVDFFKPSGKWYTTKAIKFLVWKADEADIHDAFRMSLEGHWHGLSGMTAVCLEPYHEYAHPIMLRVP